MKEIIKFQKDRLLDKQEYDFTNESVNILEEVLESGGLKIPKEKRYMLKKLFDQTVYSAFAFEIGHTDEEYKKDPEYGTVDAYADIIVFCVGAIMKLQYDPEKVIVECGKEINSRVGAIIDGKFQKDTSPEAKAKWYKADYSKCKIA